MRTIVISLAIAQARGEPIGYADREYRAVPKRGERPRVWSVEPCLAKNLGCSVTASSGSAGTASSHPCALELPLFSSESRIASKRLRQTLRPRCASVMLPKIGVKKAVGEDRRREFSVSWASMMLSFATMRSSVRSRLAPPCLQQLSTCRSLVPLPFAPDCPFSGPAWNRPAHQPSPSSSRLRSMVVKIFFGPEGLSGLLQLPPSKLRTTCAEHARWLFFDRCQA